VHAVSEYLEYGYYTFCHNSLSENQWEKGSNVIWDITCTACSRKIHALEGIGSTKTPTLHCDTQDNGLLVIIKHAGTAGSNNVVFYVKCEEDILRVVKSYTGWSDEQLLLRLRDGRIEIHSASPINFDIVTEETLKGIRLLD
jgi:hypothetical protein